MHREHTQKSILWQPASLPGVTLLRGEYLQQRLARHVHEEYALGVVTRGGLGFQYRGASHLAGAGEINIVVPGEVHTGHPEIEAFWSYRTFYIAPEVMREVDVDLGTPARSLPFFAAGVLKDPKLAAGVLDLHRDIDGGAIAPIEMQSRLLVLLSAWIRRHGERARRAKVSMRAAHVGRVREYLEDCWRERPALTQLAAMVELSSFQLLRAFEREYGVPPHAYLIQRQVREAKRMLERGVAIAEVAHTCGFADQSHLNRHFKRIWGVTPGRVRTTPPMFLSAGQGQTSKS
ncbi:transcriptional regulator [Steroidobacter agaridevorans]|uniref:Transcriptional regulator n=1 Tax=Steroidobacter agaridevorans TaxID=2695856 RepID=A0A829Y9Z7_9GAMM|nr:AraC family transcriptional regulator [Steroidobacter agaridevorans]GFE80137.1 transcriptional regulator [Steroidobacter agaridevorans]